jgi:parallel beta-helix repeat protein
MSVADVAELIRSSAQPLDEFNPGYSGLLGAGLADIGGSLHYTPVSCGQVLTTSVLLGRDLTDCPGDGLIIGAAGITLDLGGHTIDGVGLGAGIRNDGFASVTITNGTVQEFDFGVQLTAGAALNTIASLTAQLNQEAGIQLSDAGNGNTLSSNAVVGNKIGIALMDGAPGAVVIDNTIAGNSGHGLHLARSSGNLLQANRVAGSSDLAVLLEEASGNTLVGNTISDSSDGALAILAGSNGNRVEGNTLTATGDAGMRVADSDGNELIANTVQAVGDTAVILENAHNNRVEGNTLTEGGDAGIYVANSAGNQLLSNTVQQMSDSGIVLNNAHGGVVRGNDLRFNAGGIELDSATGNLIESNDASHSVGTGIELEAESLGNVVVMNVASLNGGRGIAVEAELLPESLAAGNLLDRNTASGNNAGGIYIGKAGHTLAANSADNNVGWGIYVQVGNADGGGNTAAGNTEPPQCFNVACNAAPPAPPPTPSPTPTTEPTATPTPTATPEPTATPVPTPEPTATPPPDCGPAVTLSAEADAWIDQNSASNNYGSDSILKVQAKSGNNFRALIRFGLPAAPQGCAVESATLRLYAPSWKNRRTLQALRISGDWTESQVTWGNQPETTGPAATTGSGSGYRQWDVAAQVQAMYDNGANHGFLIRDANEGGGGSEQQFHSREKGESMPELVITFGPAGG